MVRRMLATEVVKDMYVAQVKNTCPNLSTDLRVNGIQGVQSLVRRHQAQIQEQGVYVTEIKSGLPVGMDSKSVEVPRGSYIAAVRAGG